MMVYAIKDCGLIDVFFPSQIPVENVHSPFKICSAPTINKQHYAWLYILH